jgi:hypothetical protein
MYGRSSVTGVKCETAQFSQVNHDDEQTRTNIHTLSGIRNHGLGVHAVKAYASDREALGLYVLLHYVPVWEESGAG